MDTTGKTRVKRGEWLKCVGDLYDEVAPKEDQTGPRFDSTILGDVIQKERGGTRVTMVADKELSDDIADSL